jgi:uncharacterized protein YbaR (Trm112 family)
LIDRVAIITMDSASPLTLSAEVAALLVCPSTGQPLHLASATELPAWTHPEPFEAAFVTSDGSIAYPVRGGFPILVAAEALHRE